MTHILITDLREIRYMAYVPEEPKVCAYRTCDRNDTCMNHCRRAMDERVGYQSALEKTKRESIKFDHEEDCKKIIMAIFYSMAEQDNISPGIYQVPVEVEIVHKNHHGYLSCCRSESECSCGEQVARIKSSTMEPFKKFTVYEEGQTIATDHVPYESNEESQEKLWREVLEIRSHGKIHNYKEKRLTNKDSLIMEKREIKFRAWHNETEQMLFVGDAFGTTHPLDCAVYAKNQDVVLMQFTGLRDKNGVDIYPYDLIRVRGKMGNDQEYSFDAIYQVHLITFSGIFLQFIKLTNQEPDSRENSYPIHSYASFEDGRLCTDYRNDNYESLAFKDHYYDDSTRKRHQDHHYTNDLKVIGNIYQNPDLLPSNLAIDKNK